MFNFSNIYLITYLKYNLFSHFLLKIKIYSLYMSVFFFFLGSFYFIFDIFDSYSVYYDTSFVENEGIKFTLFGLALLEKRFILNGIGDAISSAYVTFDYKTDVIYTRPFNEYQGNSEIDRIILFLLEHFFTPSQFGEFFLHFREQGYEFGISEPMTGLDKLMHAFFAELYEKKDPEWFLPSYLIDDSPSNCKKNGNVVPLYKILFPQEKPLTGSLLKRLFSLSESKSSIPWGWDYMHILNGFKKKLDHPNVAYVYKASKSQMDYAFMAQIYDRAPIPSRQDSIKRIFFTSYIFRLVYYCDDYAFMPDFPVTIQIFKNICYSFFYDYGNFLFGNDFFFKKFFNFFLFLVFIHIILYLDHFLEDYFDAIYNVFSFFL